MLPYLLSSWAFQRRRPSTTLRPLGESKTKRPIAGCRPAIRPARETLIDTISQSQMPRKDREDRIVNPKSGWAGQAQRTSFTW